ncbi:MAG: dihydrolipoyl dehydrogenase, partial [Bifidobacteriaceae bacterium]|nr:dihydrolipoyl dehydrogenase [Bifidobacteriaceae bacterium]
MAESAVYDVVILGAGSGGYATALRAAQLGLNTALIEADKVGGTCLHRGCIPTKAMLHSAEIADQVRESAKYGVNSSLEGIDIGGVNRFKQSVIDRLYKGLQGLVSGRGVNLIQGHGEVQSPNQVRVGDELIRGRNLVLGTGSYARSLPGLAIEGRVMTSDQALGLDWVPRNPIVLGGGVIGLEFASLWTSFGAKATIVEALEHLAPNEDVAVSKLLERSFRRRGIGYKLGSKVADVSQDDTQVSVTLGNGEQLTGDVLLVAVGRGPNTVNAGFESLGLQMDRGFVITDPQLRTSVEGVWAVGDIVPGLQLAHRGFAQGIAAAERIAGLNPPPLIESGIPRVTYCDPEIASVGLTEEAAKREHGEDAIETVEYNLAGNGKSQVLGTQGFVKLVRAAGGPVLGVHMLGARIGELVGEAQLIVNWEAYPEDVAELIHAHPTQDEAIGEAFLALAGKPLH